MTHRTQHALSILVGLILLFISGCGTGTYNERMEESQKRLNKTTAYFELLQPKLSDTYARNDQPVDVGNDVKIGVRLQFPRLFGQESPQNQRSLNYLAGDLPTRAKARVEYVVEDGRTRVPMVAWILHFPVIASDEEAVAQAEEVAGLLGTGALPEWEELSRTIYRDGEGIVSVELRRLTLEGEHRYPPFNENSQETERKGRADVYLVAHGDQFVVAVWSAPDSIVDSKFFEAAALATATIEMPDLSEPDDPEDEPEDE